MRARIFLRVASILTLLFGPGHTLGFPWVGTPPRFHRGDRGLSGNCGVPAVTCGRKAG
jgi:hypothetical protein